MFKRLFLSCFFVFVVFYAFPQRNQGNAAVLTVFSTEAPFYLFINNVLYNERPFSQIRIENLPNQIFDIRVESDSRSRSVASYRNLAIYNEQRQPLDITLRAVSDRRTSYKLSLYALTPLGTSAGTYSQPVVIYSFGRPNRPINSEGSYFFGTAISDVEFRRALNKIKKESFDKERLLIAQLAFQDTWLSTAQIKQVMNAFSWDEGKLEFAEMVYDQCIDKANYISLIELFTFSKSKDLLTSLIMKNSDEIRSVRRMNKREFDDFLKLVKKESFDKDRTKLLRSISSATSFNVEEIRAILSTFSFDDEKLITAKLLYDNCNAKRNYYLLLDEFTFSSSKNNLQEYILSNQ